MPLLSYPWPALWPTWNLGDYTLASVPKPWWGPGCQYVTLWYHFIDSRLTKDHWPRPQCLEKAMAPHSSTLAWKIPWTEEPGGLQSMRSLRVGHDWATSRSHFTFTHWRRKWQPTPVFLPGESRDRGAWWAAVYGVTQSRTRLKWLSSSSSLEFPSVPNNSWGIILAIGTW